MAAMINQQAAVGCLLGTAHGDALGLPYEGLSPRRAAKLLGAPAHYRLFFGRGMISDDTEHTIMVALSLLGSKCEPEAFSRALAWHLRWWFLALPAGMGLATGRACVKLLLGFPARASGVFSAGNGPAMRAPLLGVVARDEAHLQALVTASTRITHTDPKAYYGAFAVALAAHLTANDTRIDPEHYWRRLNAALGADAEGFLDIISMAMAHARGAGKTTDFARTLGLKRGVSGYVYHTVPVCIHAWLRYPRDVTSAVEAVIACGGDADSTAAIVGGMAGAAGRSIADTEQRLQRLLDWPWRVARIIRLGQSLGTDARAPPAPRPWWLLRLPRNLLFLAIVLAHGLRRLAPPY